MNHREILEACWKGYHKEGMKTMFGKRYPNCVKNKKTNEEQQEDVSEVHGRYTRQSESMDQYEYDLSLLTESELEEDLKKWFKEKWVRFGPDGKIRGECGGRDSGEGKPKCLPASKAHSLGKKVVLVVLQKNVEKILIPSVAVLPKMCLLAHVT